MLFVMEMLETIELLMDRLIKWCCYDYQEYSESTINTRFWDRAYDTNLPGFYIDIPNNNVFRVVLSRYRKYFDDDYEFFATDDLENLHRN